MTVRAHVRILGTLAILALIMVPPAVAQTPEGVSPGEMDRIVEIEGRCPSFYWSGVSGAAAYELVVYRLPDQPEASGTTEIELFPSDLVLRARVPGGATAWQPSLTDGLEPGADHVWFVRAVLGEEAGDVVETGDWSAGRFFAVSPAPSQREIEYALEVLRRAADPGAAGTAALDEPLPEARRGSPARAAARRRTVPPGGEAKSVPTATAAIRGSSPDTTGEVYGVVGISASPDGAGVAAANAAGGPDLVLDGSADGFADAHLSERSIDRPSPDIESFSFTNSIGGTLNLSVDGEVSAVSLAGNGAALTGVDADSLDGMNGADYATDAEAAGLVAVHAASAAHDGRYYTETELSTSGTANAVHWDNLGGVPPGFADGVDNETTYNPGPGLIVDGDEIRIDPAAFSTSISTIDAAGGGIYTSIAIGADGLGLISYTGSSNGDPNLKVAHCNNATCSSAATYTLDSAGDVGYYTSIAIGDDGLGLISYHSDTNSDLKVAHCNDAACSSAATYTLDFSGDVGKYTSIAIGADGFGLISYYDQTNGDLKVAHCDDTACSTATIATLDNVGDVGRYTSIAIGADGLGLISYFDVSNLDLKVAHCNNAACLTAATTTLDSASDVGAYTSIAIGADDLGLISYFDGTYGYLKVAHCNNAACSTAAIATLYTYTLNWEGLYTSIAIGADGLGLISYWDYSDDDLEVAHCRDAACSGATSATLDSASDVGSYSSIAIGADGLGLISYFDVWAGLKVAHLGIGEP